MSGGNTLIRCAVVKGQSHKAALGQTVGGRVLAQQSNKRVAYTHPTPYVHHGQTGIDGGTEKVIRE